VVSNIKRTYDLGCSESNLNPTDIIDILGTEYGGFEHARRIDPIEEVVYTILSQHTSDNNSTNAFKKLIRRYGTMEEVARTDVSEIAETISSGGLARIKAPRIKAILNLILEKRGSLDISFLSKLPLHEAKAWLRNLPGIGPKSAGVILCFSLGMPAMAVDTHVYRVSKRLGLIGPRVNVEDAHEILENMVSPDQVYPFHAALIIHGRRTCKARTPNCAECKLAYNCPSRK
jgi:endonuclease-3